jgi:hypothetical protein
MKQEDIIRMAREAGLIIDANQSGFDSVETFAALVAAAAIAAIKEALAQPEQLVAHREAFWCVDLTCKKCYGADFRFKHKSSVDKKSLTTPAQSEERNFCPRCGKRLASGFVEISIHTCTPPVAAGSQAFYGFPSEPVSTPNAGGKCVTAGETAPDKEIDPNQWAFDRGLEST